MEATTTNSWPSNPRVGSSSGGPTPLPRPIANNEAIYRQRLDKYIWIWNHRPQDNNITFWHRFVSEFFAYGCKKKICLRAYKDNSTNPLRNVRRFFNGKSPCFHCKTYSDYGYEISFEEMSLYFHNKFASLYDERLHLGIPAVHKLRNGGTLLYFPEAFEEESSKYVRIIRKGPLAVVFSPHMKIISWQFCMHHSEQFISIHPQLRDVLQNASASEPGQPCSQDMQEIVRYLCDMAKHCNMMQFDEMRLSDNDRTFMVSKSSNYMKDKMDSRIQGNMGLKESFNNNSGPEAVNVTVQNNNPSAGSNFLINHNNLVSGNLTTAHKNFSPCIISPDLGNRNITQQVNTQLPPLLNPTNFRGTSSTNIRPMKQNTAGRNCVPSHTTDALAGAQKFNLVTQLVNSKPIPNHLKRPFPENNLSSNPQKGRMTRQKQGESTGYGRVGCENHKVGKVSDLIELPSQPLTGPSLSLERGTDDSNNKGKCIMQEVEKNRLIGAERDMRPDLIMQMPSNGMQGTESFPKNNSCINPQQGSTTPQKQGEATGNGRVGSENGKVAVSDRIEPTPSQPISGPSPSFERGKDDSNNKGKRIMQEAANRDSLVERGMRPDLTMQMPSNGMRGTEFFPENNSGMNPQQGCATQQKQGETTGNSRIGNENHKVGVSNLIKLTRSQTTAGPSSSLERGTDDSNNNKPNNFLPSNGMQGTEPDSSSVGLNMTTVDGNQLTEEFLVDTDIDSLITGISNYDHVISDVSYSTDEIFDNLTEL